MIDNRLLDLNNVETRREINELIVESSHALEMFKYLVRKGFDLNNPPVLEFVSDDDLEDVEVKTLEGLLKLGAKLPKDLTLIKRNLAKLNDNNPIRQYFETKLGIKPTSIEYYSPFDRSSDYSTISSSDSD